MKILDNQLKHLRDAIRYSWSGLKIAFRKEKAFQQELLVLLFVIPVGICLGGTGVERALFIGSWMLVIVVELINSAIEAAIDRVGFEHHKLSGRAKDFGSASVFCSILLAITVWVLIIFSH